MYITSLQNLFSLVSFVLTISCFIISAVLADLPEYVGPTDRFWRFNKQQKTIIIDDKEHYKKIETCIHIHLTNKDRNEMKVIPQNRTIGQIIFETSEEEYGEVIFVEIKNAMTPVHMKAVQTLASCVRALIPSMYESRAYFDEIGVDEDGTYGGNNPTHLAPLLGIFLPEVVDDMMRTIKLAYDVAGWHESLTKPDLEYYATDDEERYNIHPEPKDLGFRASEHLTYDDFAILGDHIDGEETAYTLNYAFSDPDDYEGGELYIRDKAQEYTCLMPLKYSASVFLGGEYVHGVTEMKGGRREMFSSEMWFNPDIPVGSSLWGGTWQNMENFILECNELGQSAGEKCDFALEKMLE